MRDCCFFIYCQYEKLLRRSSILGLGIAAEAKRASKLFGSLLLLRLALVVSSVKSAVVSCPSASFLLGGSTAPPFDDGVPPLSFTASLPFTA